jgi:nitrogen-specific signal transduction histidine kinase
LSGSTDTLRLPALPTAALRTAVGEAAARLDSAGEAALAAALREAFAAWHSAQLGWTEALARELAVHHDINNALVGVRGNTQLLMLGPVAQVPGARERLDVVLRESDRIRLAGQRIHELKLLLTAVAHECESLRETRVA